MFFYPRRFRSVNYISEWKQKNGPFTHAEVDDPDMRLLHFRDERGRDNLPECTSMIGSRGNCRQVLGNGIVRTFQLEKDIRWF